MFIAYTILKITCHFGSIRISISAVAGHCRFFVFSDVFVAELEINNHFSVEITSPKLALKGTIHVLKVSSAVQFAIFEFTLVMESGCWAPFIIAFATVFSVFKLTLVEIAVLKDKFSISMKYVCKESTFVNHFLPFNLPIHFALPLHLWINKVANEMSTVWPFEFAVTKDLWVF